MVVNCPVTVVATAATALSGAVPMRMPDTATGDGTTGSNAALYGTLAAAVALVVGFGGAGAAVAMRRRTR